MPDTELSSTREATIAQRYNSITSEMKFTPNWVNAPTKKVAGKQSLDHLIIYHNHHRAAHHSPFDHAADIERWSDRFKPKASATITLTTLNQSRKYARELLPSTPAEILFDTKKRGRDTEGRK